MIFRRLLTREPNVAPWRELTRIYRRLEARGEIRGGRFVSGMTGEQFALPDAIDRLREVRRTAPDGRLLAITTADPLNLVGIITPGERVRTAARNTLVYRDGIALAVVEGDFTRPLVPMDAETQPFDPPAGQKRRAGAQPVAIHRHRPWLAASGCFQHAAGQIDRPVSFTGGPGDQEETN